MVPKDRKYTKTHEWVFVRDDRVEVGITDYAQHEMGDIVFVELPEPGNTYEQDEPTAVVESVKAVSDIFAPVSGEITGANTALFDMPQALNEAPYDTVMFELKYRDAAELDTLMSAEDYDAFIEEGQA